MSKELSTLAMMLAIYGALWLANTLLGIRNNLTSGFKWEWKVFIDGVVRALLGALALTVGAGALYMIPNVFEQAGIQVSQEVVATYSVLSIVGSIGAGVVIYAKKFTTNIRSLFDPENSVKLTVKPDESNPNKGTVGIETITGDKTAKELLENE